jgi:DNA-directed RNA polymerase I, II, and III subunit RPABC2
MEEHNEDEIDEFQKLEESMHVDHLTEIHTELKQINEKELEALSRVIKDKNGNIIDELHKTLPILTKYERARILGIRTKQINNGSQIFVENKNNIIDGYNLALLELQQKKIPYIIQRPLPNGASEYWKIQDLELIDF